VKFKVWVTVDGQDKEPVLREQVYETHVMLPGFKAGSVVRVTVTACNGVGESNPSEVVQVTVPGQVAA
jgi:hypothetical protein